MHRKWPLRDTLPLFSQAQVFNLIGHLCYLILQSLRADREREEGKEERGRGKTETEVKQAEKRTRTLTCDICVKVRLLL